MPELNFKEPIYGTHRAVIKLLGVVKIAPPGFEPGTKRL